MPSNPPNIGFVSLGCPKNLVDSEVLLTQHDLPAAAEALDRGLVDATAERVDLALQAVDALVADGVGPAPELLKIDVQGYELEVLRGAATALDMSMPDQDGPSGQIDWRPVLTNTLPYVDIFLPSIDEIVFMLRRADYDAWDGAVHDHVDAAYLADLADELLAMGTVIAGFKLGDRGAYLHTASDPAAYARLDRLNLAAAAWTGQRVYQPVFAVEVAGTTGAGDATYAGLLAALLRGLTPVEALRWACAVGACNVETVDATSGIQSWAATEARLDAGWPVSDRRVPGF